MHWTNGFGGSWMMIFWWLLIIVIVYGLFQFFRTHQKSGSNRQESALDVLEKRYAKGEITKSEFEEKRKDINN